MAARTEPAHVRFGPFELDCQSGELSKYGRKVRLQEQPCQILIVLLDRAGEVITREELQQRLWPGDTFVDFEHSLNNAVKRLRFALGDSADKPRYIETLPRKGYRFIGSLERREPTAKNASSPPPILPPVSEARSKKKALTIAFATVIIILATAALLPLERRSARPQIHSIAVLPLDNLSGDPNQRYFADGMTDELTTDLAKVGSLKVISRTSAARYRGAGEPVKQIAKELGVDALIEGSVARSNGKVRITAQLIDASTDRHLWADSYEQDLNDVLAIQNMVALEIARQVRTRLTNEEEQRLGQVTSVNTAAYDEYLKGRYSQTEQSPNALMEGLEHFKQAIAIDPSYAPAYAGLADDYTLLVSYRELAPRDALPQAEAIARKALELDPQSAEAHAALGYVEWHYRWQWVDAEKQLQTAISLSPSYAVGHLRYAEFLSSTGRHDEAVREIRRAAELDPLSLLMMSNMGRILYHARRYQEAIAVLKQTLEMDPNRVYARMHLAMSYEALGMYVDAQREYEGVKKYFGGEPSIVYAHLLAVSGRAAQARKLARFFERNARDSDWFFIAGLQGALGDKDEALACLEKAYQKRDFFLVFLKVHPQLDALRDDPRFAAQVKRIGLQ